MNRLNIPILATLLGALNTSPVLAQEKCIPERVMLILQDKTIVLETSHDICVQDRRNIEVRHYKTKKVYVTGVASLWYKMCLETQQWGLEKIAADNASLDDTELTLKLQKSFVDMTDACLETSRKKWLNFTLPEEVTAFPFPPEARKEGIILFSTVVLWNRAQVVESGNFPLGQDGAYYLENPFTKEVLLTGDEKMKRFIELFHKKAGETVFTTPQQAAQLVVDTAKEVQ
jgi:hypothetical protein